MERRNIIVSILLSTLFAVLQLVSMLLGLRLLVVLSPQLLPAEPLYADAANGDGDITFGDNTYLFALTVGQLAPLLLLSPSMASMASAYLSRTQNQFDLRLDSHGSTKSHACGSLAPTRNDFGFILSFRSGAVGGR